MRATAASALLFFFACACRGSISLTVGKRKKFQEQVIDDDSGTLCSQLAGDIDETTEGCWSGCGERCLSIHLAPDLQSSHKLAAEAGQVKTCKLPNGKKSVRRFCVVKEAGVLDTAATAQHVKRRQRQTADDVVESASASSSFDLEQDRPGQGGAAPGVYPQPMEPPGGVSAVTWILIVVGFLLVLIMVLVFCLVTGKTHHSDEYRRRV